MACIKYTADGQHWLTNCRTRDICRRCSYNFAEKRQVNASACATSIIFDQFFCRHSLSLHCTHVAFVNCLLKKLDDDDDYDDVLLGSR